MIADEHRRDRDERGAPVRPFRHFRLVVFFAGTTGLGIVVGILRLRALGERPAGAEVEWVLGSTVALTAFVGFVGVFVHRLRVLPLRWKEQMEIERQLQIHERLSSIGLLTAGVAHEINNPLEGIGNYLKLLEREEDAGKRARHLEQVRHGFARIREIVLDLLRFARPAAGAGEADLAQVVASARRLAAYSDKMKGVEVRVEGLEEPLLVVGDPGRLEQVVVNLLLNAATAMGSKGRVTIRARRTSEVELAIEDEGPGIPPADLDRIFDPFFTTTGGTGLGLSVSYGIVRAHGGTLTARNREGGGAEFAIRFPPRSPTRAGTQA
jgi:signal transduction histidine kinase